MRLTESVLTPLPHPSQDLRHSSVMPSPLIDTWEHTKGQVVPMEGTKGQVGTTSGEDKVHRTRLAVEQPHLQQQQRPAKSRIPPPQMSPHEANSIVHRMSSDLMISYAQTSSSLAALLQVHLHDVFDTHVYSNCSPSPIPHISAEFHSNSRRPSAQSWTFAALNRRWTERRPCVPLRASGMQEPLSANGHCHCMPVSRVDIRWMAETGSLLRRRASSSIKLQARK